MNILLIEDELKTSKLLKEIIEEHPEHLVVSVCDSVESSVAYLSKNQNKLDLIFMDVLLADGNSFQIFDKIGIKVPVIFCTAYNEYALKAFKHNGIEYILKPFKEEDIAKAFAKIDQLKKQFFTNKKHYQYLADQIAGSKTYHTSILVKFRDKMFPVEVADIAFICLENELIGIHTFSNEKHIVFKTIDEIESAIDPKQFFRINRQMIISRIAVAGIETNFNRKVAIKTNINLTEKPIVSRLKVSAFLSWIEKP